MNDLFDQLRRLGTDNIRRMNATQANEIIPQSSPRILQIDLLVEQLLSEGTLLPALKLANMESGVKLKGFRAKRGKL